MRDFAARLNDALKGSAQASGIHFIDVYDAFEGHNACSNDGEWVRGLVASSAAFHPNIAGHEAYAGIAQCYLNTLIDVGWPLNAIGLPLNPADAGLPLPVAVEACTSANGGASPLSQSLSQSFATQYAIGDFSDEQLAEVGAVEFDEADIVTIGALVDAPSCVSDLVPNQQIVIVADGYQPGSEATLTLGDSVLYEDRLGANSSLVDESGEVVFTAIVPSDGLTDTAEQSAALRVDVLGMGSENGGLRVASAGASLELAGGTNCEAELSANGELSPDGVGPAPRSLELTNDFAVLPTALPVLPSAQPPVALPDSVLVMTGDEVLVDVLANDTSFVSPLNELSLAVLDQVGQGLVEVSIDVDDAALLFTADAVPGSTTIIYEVCDERTQCVTSVLLVTTISQSTCTLVGTDGDDELIGTDRDDIICGLGGNDTIEGMDGDDVLMGGPGADVLRGGPGADEIHGGQGADVLRGGRGADEIRGGRGADEIHGGAGDDVLRGGRGPDEVHGGLGADAIFGGRGGDDLLGGGGADELRGRKGDDDLWGGAGPDLLRGGLGDDFGDGGAGSDQCIAVETRVSCSSI